MEVKDKSTGNVLREVRENTLSEAVNILDRASAASYELASISREDLARGLLAISASMGNSAGTLSRAISLETGRALKGSREDVELAALEFRNAAHQLYASLTERATIPVDSFDTSIMTFNLKSPVGVVLLYASPVENISHSAKIISAAISAGNSVVCLPSTLSPGPFEELMKMLETGGLPKDLFQVVILREDSRAIKDILKNGMVSQIVLVGHEPVFRHLLSEIHGKRILSAGKAAAPVIIWDDADLDAAVEYVSVSAFSGCNGDYAAARKIILREGSYEYFRNRLIELASGIMVGNADEEDTDLGPLPDEAYVIEAAKQLDEAVNAGASVAYGGNPAGAFFPPTIVEYLPQGSPILWGNPYVPIVCLERVDSMEAAIRAANDFKYHLQASLFTSDIDLATSAAEKLDFSSILINEAPGSCSGFWYRGYESRDIKPEKISNLREEFFRTKIVKLKK